MLSKTFSLSSSPHFLLFRPPHPIHPPPTPRTILPHPSGPVQVFILMGQSNMLGEGKVNGNTNGTLEFAVKTEGKYPYLVNKTGGWTVLPTLRNVAVMGSGNESFERSTFHHNEFMTVNTTLKDTIGPELGIGFTLYNNSQAPTMVLKSCIGDRALGWDLLPPGTKQVRVTLGEKRAESSGVAEAAASRRRPFHAPPFSLIKAQKSTPIP